MMQMKKRGTKSSKTRVNGFQKLKQYPDASPLMIAPNKVVNNFNSLKIQRVINFTFISFEFDKLINILESMNLKFGFETFVVFNFKIKSANFCALRSVRLTRLDSIRRNYTDVLKFCCLVF